MPNSVVNLVFNPPQITLIGTGLKQEAIDALERELLQCTTTSQNKAAATCAPKFSLVSASKGCDKSIENRSSKCSSVGGSKDIWQLSIPQHYCDQLGRCCFFAAVLNVMSDEGWTLSTACASTVGEEEKDVTRLYFSRS
ncbi:hypothetical protein ERJ75_001402100 [Trypanosoma vivax]|nr:hypothetical protein TRVL_06597 [Trypanosoma vivax]KAH8607530.1 hypothetical protein ERJ75_001402100 [Trypanosoma vivax]